MKSECASNDETSFLVSATNESFSRKRKLSAGWFITASNGNLFHANAFWVNHLGKVTFLWSKVALWWFEMKCSSEAFFGFHPESCNETSDRKWNINAQREKVNDLWHDFNIYLWNGCTAFIFNNRKEATESPKIFIYICKNTKLSKIFEWKFTIVLTKSFDVVFVLKYSEQTHKKSCYLRNNFHIWKTNEGK